MKSKFPKCQYWHIKSHKCCTKIKPDLSRVISMGGIWEKCSGCLNDRALARTLLDRVRPGRPPGGGLGKLYDCLRALVDSEVIMDRGGSGSGVWSDVKGWVENEASYSDFRLETMDWRLRRAFSPRVSTESLRWRPLPPGPALGCGDPSLIRLRRSKSS